MFKDKFRKFNGEMIPDIVEYIKEYLIKDPTATITVGCDSVRKKDRTVYAITIMMYNSDIKNGAHIVFYKESQYNVKNAQDRLYREAEYLYNIGIFLDEELSPFYKRKDLNETEIKKYKYHLSKCNGEYSYISPQKEKTFIENLKLSKSEIDSVFRLVDLHVDFNPYEFNYGGRSNSRNKSFIAYKNYVPWLRGTGFRTWAKSESFAAKSADSLLK